MDFDEYEYLESTVENPEIKKLEDNTNGNEEKTRSRGSKYRSDDDGDDLVGHTKRSRRDSDDYERDRNSRYGSSSKERERGEKDKHISSRERRSKEKEEGNEKEKNRDRDRDRDWERGDRDRERAGDRKRDVNRERREREFERERNGEKERERNGEKERERSKRDRQHPERHNGRRGDKSRDVEIPDKDDREKPRDKEFRDQDKGIRRYRQKKEDATEPEVDPERDQRTVFAYQISLKAGERDIYEFFSRAGKVRDVQLIMDRNTRRSKGVGYIEFYDAMSVPMAIALSGQPLLGTPVMVKPSEAEKNLVQPTPVASEGGGLVGLAEARKLYVGNLPITIKEEQIRLVFESFGAVELVQMPSDPGTGNCKGYAFVQFSRFEDAKAAQNLNGQLEIAGRVIKVSAVTDQVGMQDAGAKAVDFDDDEGSGLSLNAHSRALLMQKLDRTGTASSITGSSAAPVSVQVLPGLSAADLSAPTVAIPSVDTVGFPSECLLLKNMFDPNLETEPDFDLDIKEDVTEECSKFGRLKHIYVEKNSAGFVYLRFENTQSASAAQRALHGRWFAGKMITASFMPLQSYEAKFPDSS